MKEKCKMCGSELLTKLGLDIGYCSECANKYPEAAERALEIIEGDRWKKFKEKR